MNDARHLTPPADARRLHPLSPLMAVVPLLRQLVLPAVLILFGNWRISAPLLVGGFAVLLALIALRAYFTRFTLDEDELLVWSGVLQRTVRVVSPARVQQVEVVRNLAHRATGLAAVRVELVGTGIAGTRVELDALPIADAEQLRDTLERGRRRVAAGDEAAASGVATDVPAPPPATLLRLSTRQLVVAGLTGAPILLVPPLIVSVAFELLDVVRAGGGTSIQPERIPVIVLIVGVLVLWPIIAGGVMVFRCHGFELGRSGHDLVARRGLLDTRTSVLPLPRVQLVDRNATIVRRWLKLSSLTVRTASGGATSQYPVGVTVPIGPGATIDDLIGVVLDRPGVPLAVTAHPLAARRRAITRRIVGVGVPGVGLVVTSTTLNGAAVSTVLTAAAVALAASFAIAVAWGRSWYRRLGHTRRDGLLLVREGVLVEHLRVVPVDRIQSIRVSHNPWQRRAGLCTIRLHLAGMSDTVRVPDLTPADAMDLAATVRGLDTVDATAWSLALSGRG